MSFMPYAEQLKNPQWQKRRLEMLVNADWKCDECGNKEKTLNVHHKRYVKGRMVWEYDNYELSVLCDVCHDLTHKKLKIIDKIILEVDLNEILGVLVGYFVGTSMFAKEEIALALTCSRYTFLRTFIDNNRDTIDEHIIDLLKPLVSE